LCWTLHKWSPWCHFIAFYSWALCCRPLNLPALAFSFLSEGCCGQTSCYQYLVSLALVLCHSRQIFCNWSLLCHCVHSLKLILFFQSAPLRHRVRHRFREAPRESGHFCHCLDVPVWISWPRQSAQLILIPLCRSNPWHEWTLQL